MLKAFILVMLEITVSEIKLGGIPKNQNYKTLGAE